MLYRDPKQLQQLAEETERQLRDKTRELAVVTQQQSGSPKQPKLRGAITSREKEHASMAPSHRKSLQAKPQPAVDTRRLAAEVANRYRVGGALP